MRETENNINFNHPSLCDDFAPTLAIQCSLRFFDKGSLQDKHLNVKDDKSAWRPWEKALFTRELDKNTVLMTFIEKFPRELLDTSKSCGKGRTVKIGNEIFKEHGFYHVHHEVMNLKKKRKCGMPLTNENHLFTEFRTLGRYCENSDCSRRT